MSFRTRLFIILILASSLPLIIFSIIIYKPIYQLVYQNVVSKEQELLEKDTSNLNLILNTYQNLATNLADQLSSQETIEKILKNDGEESQTSTILDNILNTYYHIQSISILSSNQETLFIAKQSGLESEGVGISSITDNYFLGLLKHSQFFFNPPKGDQLGITESVPLVFIKKNLNLSVKCSFFGHTF